MKLLLAAAFAGIACAAPADDAIPSVPDYGTPPSAQYSGFLNASAVEDGTYLHYWCVLHSQQPPSFSLLFTDVCAFLLCS